ncbi:MAG: NAD(P)-dependent oxidoreductase, partial [Pseudomonadota bacterium]
MTHYALFANLHDQPCLVIGAGEVGARKAKQLVDCGARVTVVALEVGSAVAAMLERGELAIIEGAFEPHHLDGQLLVIAATSDDELNQRIADGAAERATLCNVVDDTPRCTFILPALIRRGPVTIAISTAGYAPVLARWIKSHIERWLPARIGELAEFANGWRDQVRRTLTTIDQRRRLWEVVFGGPVAQDLIAGRRASAHRRMTGLLAGDAARPAVGEAWLVGAGPGDANLITLRGYELLRTADVVLYDRLAAPELLK